MGLRLPPSPSRAGATPRSGSPSAIHKGLWVEGERAGLLPLALPCGGVARPPSPSPAPWPSARERERPSPPRAHAAWWLAGAAPEEEGGAGAVERAGGREAAREEEGGAGETWREEKGRLEHALAEAEEEAGRERRSAVEARRVMVGARADVPPHPASYLN